MCENFFKWIGQVLNTTELHQIHPVVAEKLEYFFDRNSDKAVNHIRKSEEKIMELNQQIISQENQIKIMQSELDEFAGQSSVHGIKMNKFKEEMKKKYHDFLNSNMPDTQKIFETVHKIQLDNLLDKNKNLEIENEKLKKESQEKDENIAQLLLTTTKLKDDYDELKDRQNPTLQSEMFRNYMHRLHAEATNAQMLQSNVQRKTITLIDQQEEMADEPEISFKIEKECEIVDLCLDSDSEEPEEACGMNQVTKLEQSSSIISIDNEEDSCELIEKSAKEPQFLKRIMDVILPRDGGSDQSKKQKVIKQELPQCSLKVQKMDICVHCNRKFISSPKLRDHILDTHFDKLNCELCDYSSGSKGCMIVHVMTQHEKASEEAIINLVESIKLLKQNWNKLKYE